ncbi:H-type small acid-soluble spore protein [Bacillaceae bacterium S4-13-56]
MDAQRAQDISNQQEMMPVTYNGEAIYIEHVDRVHGMATIHPLNNPGNKQSVSVTSLEEK